MKVKTILYQLLQNGYTEVEGLKHGQSVGIRLRQGDS